MSHPSSYRKRPFPLQYLVALWSAISFRPIQWQTCWTNLAQDSMLRKKFELIKMLFQRNVDNNDPQENSKKLKDLCQDYWQTMNRLSPLAATANNIPGVNDKLDDISPEGRVEKAKQKTRLLTAAYKINSNVLAPVEQDTLEIIQYNLAMSIEEDNQKLYRWDVDHMYGPQTTFPMTMFRTQPTATEKDALDYISRLQQIPKFLSDHINNLKEGLEHNQSSALAAVQRTINVLDELLKIPYEDSLFAGVTKKFSSDIILKYQSKMLDVIKNSVYPAFQKYKAFLENDYVPYARTNDKPGLIYMPGGKEIYDFAIKFHTTEEKTGEEIHQLGMKDLENIHKEIKEIATRLGHEGDVLSFINKIINDPKNFFTDSDDILQTAKQYVEILSKNVDTMFATSPQTPLEVRPMEAFRAANGINGQYYQPPLDLSRSGIFYINTHNPSIRPRYNVMALCAHEALPGHHMQFATQLEQKDFPEFRRMNGGTYFTEGWGLYTERLADEMGMYTDDLSKFGMLTMQAYRAARLVVDTGLHAMGWTREKAIDFMAKNVPLKKEEIEIEIDRYLSSTTGGHVRAGQALAYKMGQYQLDELLQNAKSRLGDDFDIRQFHSVLLKHGPAPKAILSKILDREIDAKTLDNNMSYKTPFKRN